MKKHNFKIVFHVRNWTSIYLFIVDPARKFLMCYEYETKIRLGYKDLDDILENVLQLPKDKGKTFENFAGKTDCVEVLLWRILSENTTFYKINA